MTNPTNWPNPERPGVPIFPNVSRWHWVMLLGEPIAVKWDAPSESWRLGNYSYYPGPDWDLNWEYCSPIFTPTQIAELLAGERERCAKECDEKVSFANHELRASGSHEETRYWTGEHCAATFCADAIRGLGDKA